MATVCLRRVLSGCSSPNKSSLFYLHNSLRRLSTQQVNVALRPFYFSVHPDLFCQHPHLRTVNEESLKLLHNYLDVHSAPHSGCALSSKCIVFYLRSADEKWDLPQSGNNFRQVEINLSADVHATVRRILQTCGLPLSYIDSLPKTSLTTPAAGRTIVWHDVYPRDRGTKAQTTAKPKIPEISLRWWLRRNYKKALQLRKAADPVHKHIDELKCSLCQQTGLESIAWRSEWGSKQFQTSLSRLKHIYDQAHNQLHPELLKGRSLIFGQQTGVSLSGDVILSTKDVPQTWIKFLSSLWRYDRSLELVPVLERTLSSLLNNIEVHRRLKGPLIMVTEYENQLRKLIRSISKFRLQLASTRMDGDLSVLKLVVECATGPITLSPTGKILIPDECPAFLVIQFISNNKQEAINTRNAYRELRQRELDAKRKCKLEFGLCSLKREPNVSSEQMALCCERLLAKPSHVARLVYNAQLRISKFYSVMSDGEMHIPWNWK